MRDAWEPLADDVRKWANSTADPWENEPCQDWPLALAWSRHEETLLRLAADESCPSREYMLFILYFIVGHAMKNEFDSTAQPLIEGFIRRGDQFKHPDIKQWQARSLYLLRYPDTFDWQHWCGGEFTRIAG